MRSCIAYGWAIVFCLIAGVSHNAAGKTESQATGNALTVEPQLTVGDAQNAVKELRAKHLLLPLVGIDSETLKGSYYQMRGSGIHHAVDIASPRNTPVLACDDGTIARLFLSKLGGTTIYMYDSSGKYIYYYAHLERYADNLKQGQLIRKGQVIGFVGTSGNAPPNFPHLHFSISRVIRPGVWYPSAPIDPYEVFSNKHGF